MFFYFRILFLILFILGLDLYAYTAISSLFPNWTKSSKQLLSTIYWAIPIVTILFLILTTIVDTSIFNKNIYITFRTILFMLYICKFFMCFVFLFDDGRRSIVQVINHFTKETTFSPSRNRFITQIGIAIGTLPFGLLSYGMIRNRYRFTMFRETLPILNLADNLIGLKIIQISDIHSGSYLSKEPLYNVIDLINKENPDLVFFTGDLVNNVASEMHPYMDVFDKIKSKHGVYSIFGNHDYGDYVRWDSEEEKMQNKKDLIAVHSKLGWNLMLNENKILDINGEKIGLIGLENFSALPQFPKYGKLAESYKGIEEAPLKILLSHDPTHWDFEVIPNFKDIQITLAGHTHGGQFGIEIPGFKWSPVKFMYKQWAGLYSKDNQHLYVNRGLGMLGYPGRVGILPEISVLTLKKV
jgi:uncharacterized protein